VSGGKAELFEASKLLMDAWFKWSAYLRSLLVLCLFPQKAQCWVTEVELQRDCSKWSLSTPVLFFDIDDTLAEHGLGLSTALVLQLNEWVERGHRVILLTNCSEARAREHRSRREEWRGRFEIWPVGMKPNVRWMKAKMEAEAILPEECSMFGDRPTMDMWMAWQLGFARRVWVQAWGRSVDRKGVLGWLQKQEWKWISRSY
jgi:FMN phosphatase YigB (HAD superfamily)